MLDLVNICGEVVIGEGIKDEAPGLFKGEKVGSWKAGSPRFEIALDPVDGTTNASKGMPKFVKLLARRAVVKREEGDYEILGYDRLTAEQVQELKTICDRKLAEYIARRGEAIWPVFIELYSIGR
jgi:hypothetical protein